MMYQVLEIDTSSLALTGEFRATSTDEVIRAVTNEPWSWAPERYLWVKPKNVLGGIDIELDHFDERRRQFLSDDMLSRGVELDRREEMMRRAAGGACYTLRLSFFQPHVMQIALIGLAAALAVDADGYIYTLDAGWGAAVVPVSGTAFGRLLLDRQLRLRSGLQSELEQAKKELDVTERFR
jgi:hypothetical protein